MQPPAQPEILSPRIKRAKGLFDDDNLDILSHILDDFIRIPGTPIRLGLDGLVGLIPGFGDVLGGIASFIIILAAWMRGVPYVVVTRMAINVGIEVVIGSIPLFGDIFDIAWRANRRNYVLLTGSLQQPRRYTLRSWLFLATLCVAMFFLMLIPLLIVTWLARGIVHHLFGVDVHFKTWF